MGRGKVGKSTALAWAAWRAIHQGRGDKLLIADFDHRSSTLSDLFGDCVIRVDGGTLSVAKQALADLLVRMVEEQKSAIVDFGTGDDLLTHLSEDLPVEEFCDEWGIDPLPLFCMGAEREDLRHAAAIWKAGYFRAERAALVLNAGRERLSETGLEELLRVKDDPAFVEMEASAPAAIMTHLPCMPRCLVPGLGFYRASYENGNLDLWNRAVTKKWLHGMELECAEFSERLP